MIKFQIDFSEATPEELSTFYEIPGLLDALAAINTRGRELNVQASMIGGEQAVARFMEKHGLEFRPHIDYDEYHKLGHPVNELLRPMVC